MIQRDLGRCARRPPPNHCRLESSDCVGALERGLPAAVWMRYCDGWKGDAEGDARGRATTIELFRVANLFRHSIRHTELKFYRISTSTRVREAAKCVGAPAHTRNCVFDRVCSDPRMSCCRSTRAMWPVDWWDPLWLPVPISLSDVFPLE